MKKKKSLFLLGNTLLFISIFFGHSMITTAVSTNLQTETVESIEETRPEKEQPAETTVSSSSSFETELVDPTSEGLLEEKESLVERQNTSFAAALPEDPNIIPIDKVFQKPIGNSTSILEDGKLLQLNPASKSQKGAIWSKKPISLLSDFTFKSYLYLGDQQSNAGDGMTFTLTNDSRMGTNADQVIGSPGMGIGSYSTKTGQPNIKSGLSIEFDTYKNQGLVDRMDREIGSDDKGYGHVAFVTPKENNNNPSGEHSGVTVAPTHLSNGTWRMLTVRWDAQSQQLTYELEGVGSSSLVLNDLNGKFGGSMVYWGFTSSTGGKYQENALAMTQIPSSVKSFAQASVNGGEFAPEVEASKGDTITLKNALTVDNDLMSAQANTQVEQPQASIELPPELVYEQDSLTIDGAPVAAEDLSIIDSKVVVNLANYLVLEKEMVLTLDTKLQDAIPETRLSLEFEYLENGTMLQKSNELHVQVAKPKEKTLTVFYRDATNNQELTASKQVTGKIGESYKELPISIDGFVFKNDSGNAEGVFAEDSQDIHFYYRTGELYFLEAPKQLAFGTLKVTNLPLVKFGQSTEGLRVMDERKQGKWQVQLKQSQPFSNGEFTMPYLLSFVSNTAVSHITDNAITVTESDKKGETDLSSLLDQSQQRGIKADIPVEYQRLGTFKGALSWSLVNAPAN